MTLSVFAINREYIRIRSTIFYIFFLYSDSFEYHHKHTPKYSNSFTSWSQIFIFARELFFFFFPRIFKLANIRILIFEFVRLQKNRMRGNTSMNVCMYVLALSQIFVFANNFFWIFEFVRLQKNHIRGNSILDTNT